MRRHVLSFALLITACVGARAQWELQHPLVLDGPQATDRQVTGLALPTAIGDGASVNADRDQSTLFATATGTSALTATLTPTPLAYGAGMRITFVPTQANDSAATFQVNGLGVYPLRKNINMALDSGDLRPGVPVQVVFDGYSFQVSDQLYPGCPSGFAPVSADVCIQLTSNDTMSWYAAVLHCADRGARLCGFSDWMQGCLSLPGFLATVSDYEWVDSAGNYNNMAKLMGWTDGLTSPDCHAGSRQIPQAKFRSRCCYDR